MVRDPSDANKRLEQVYYNVLAQPAGGASAVIDGQVVPVEMNEVGTNATEAQKAELDAFWQSIGSTDGLSEEQKAEKERQAHTEVFKNKCSAYVQTMKLSGAYGSVDLSLPGVQFPAEGVSITFPAPSVKVSDRVLVLHLRADGIWERSATLWQVRERSQVRLLRFLRYFMLWLRRSSREHRIRTVELYHPQQIRWFPRRREKRICHIWHCWRCCVLLEVSF